MQVAKALCTDQLQKGFIRCMVGAGNLWTEGAQVTGSDFMGTRSTAGFLSNFTTIQKFGCRCRT